MWILLGVINYSRANTIEALVKFEDRIYFAYEESDLTFNVRIKELDVAAKNLALAKNVNDINAKVYIMNDQFAFELQNTQQINLDLQIRVKEFFSEKLSFFKRPNISKWLDGYILKETDGDWMTYEDSSSSKDVFEIKIKIEKEALTIIEYRSVGTMKTKFLYSKMPWSKNKLVLNKIEQNIYEGNQSIKNDTKLTYRQIEKKWFLDKIKTITELKATKLSKKGRVNRVIEENIEVNGYAINKSKALQWFTQQK